MRPACFYEPCIKHNFYLFKHLIADIRALKKSIYTSSLITRWRRSDNAGRRGQPTHAHLVTEWRLLADGCYGISLCSWTSWWFKYFYLSLQYSHKKEFLFKEVALLVGFLLLFYRLLLLLFFGTYVLTTFYLTQHRAWKGAGHMLVYRRRPLRRRITITRI